MQKLKTNVGRLFRVYRRTSFVARASRVCACAFGDKYCTVSSTVVVLVRSWMTRREKKYCIGIANMNMDRHTLASSTWQETTHRGEIHIYRSSRKMTVCFLFLETNSFTLFIFSWRVMEKGRVGMFLLGMR